jgi:hypothetical protein
VHSVTLRLAPCGRANVRRHVKLDPLRHEELDPS